MAARAAETDVRGVMPTYWMGIMDMIVLLLVGAILLAAVAGIARDGLHREQELRLVCPRLNRAVDCTIVQDVRTGQWTGVERCSVFDPPSAIACDQDCARTLNLGFRLGERPRPSAP
jgi:hypothetical protein